MNTEKMRREGTLPNKTVLFADDSLTMRLIMAKTFAGEPYAVETVPSGEAAIMKAKELRPAIIIADAGMAGVSGYDVCKAVREDSELVVLNVKNMRLSLQLTDRRARKEEKKS